MGNCNGKCYNICDKTVENDISDSGSTNTSLYGLYNIDEFANEQSYNIKTNTDTLLFTDEDSKHNAHIV